jgi:hypothetical protein
VLEEALGALLDPNRGGWTGPASEAFEEEVTKVVEFAKDISESLASTASNNSQFNVLAEAVETIRDYQDRNRENGNSKGYPTNLSEEADRKLPPAPWWIDGRIKIYHAYENMIGWGGSWDNQTDHEYFAYDTWKAGDQGYKDGESAARNGIVSTSPDVVHGNGPWEQLLSNYGEYEGVDNSETVLPKEPFDWDAFFELTLTVDEVEHVDPFPHDIWTPGTP